MTDLLHLPRRVALLAEGVDRNSQIVDLGVNHIKVALLAEGVDRNLAGDEPVPLVIGRPPRGGRG